MLAAGRGTPDEGCSKMLASCTASAGGDACPTSADDHSAFAPIFRFGVRLGGHGLDAGRPGRLRKRAQHSFRIGVSSLEGRLPVLPILVLRNARWCAGCANELTNTHTLLIPHSQAA